LRSGLLIALSVIIAASLMISSPAFAQIHIKGLHHPGIRWAWPIKADQYTFTVNTTSNYDMET